MTWVWADLPRLFGESEASLARSTRLARSTLQRLRGDADARLGVLITLYRHGCAKPIMVTDNGWSRLITFHDLIHVEGVTPSMKEVMRREPLEGTPPAPLVERVWWNLAWLRKAMGDARNAAPIGVADLAAAAHLYPTHLYDLEGGKVLGNVKTLMALFITARQTLPTVTLHDLLIVAPV